MDKLLVYPERMKANLESSKGLIYSQAVLLALTKQGADARESLCARPAQRDEDVGQCQDVQGIPPRQTPR